MSKLLITLIPKGLVDVSYIKTIYPYIDVLCSLSIILLFFIIIPVPIISADSKKFLSRFKFDIQITRNRYTFSLQIMYF